jgi:hypothetical protein
MNSDYESIMALVKRNDHFYNYNLIKKEEYIYNNLFLASKLEIIINKTQKIAIREFLDDNMNLSKFKLSIQILKTASN